MPGGEQGFDIARIAAVLLGWDPVPKVTVNRFCNSSLQAIRMAAQAVRCGDADVVVAAGVESQSQSRLAYGSSDTWPDTENPAFRSAGRRTVQRSGPGVLLERPARTGPRRAVTAFPPRRALTAGNSAPVRRGCRRRGDVRERRTRPRPHPAGPDRGHRRLGRHSRNRRPRTRHRDQDRPHPGRSDPRGPSTPSPATNRSPHRSSPTAPSRAWIRNG
ncbi:beta-ketoacyl synthase N-terminal-like domain-containing protein [Streptomyces sp. NBC_01367]|uniref:thiolase family protein n=1 Tax=unclassified Streptomyces TaxID=2593676 RepID=UPI003867906A